MTDIPRPFARAAAELSLDVMDFMRGLDRTQALNTPEEVAAEFDFVFEQLCERGPFSEAVRQTLSAARVALEDMPYGHVRDLPKCGPYDVAVTGYMDSYVDEVSRDDGTAALRLEIETDISEPALYKRNCLHESIHLAMLLQLVEQLPLDKAREAYKQLISPNGDMLMESTVAAVEASILSRVSLTCLENWPPQQDAFSSFHSLCLRVKEAGEQGYMDMRHRHSDTRFVIYNDNPSEEQLANMKEMIAVGTYQQLGESESFQLAWQLRFIFRNPTRRSDIALLDDIKVTLGFNGTAPLTGIGTEVAELCDRHREEGISLSDTLADIKKIALRESMAPRVYHIASPWLGKGLTMPLTTHQRKDWIESVTQGLTQPVLPTTRIAETSAQIALEIMEFVHGLKRTQALDTPEAVGTEFETIWKQLCEGNLFSEPVRQSLASARDTFKSLDPGQAAPAQPCGDYPIQVEWGKHSFVQHRRSKEDHVSRLTIAVAHNESDPGYMSRDSVHETAHLGMILELLERLPPDDALPAINTLLSANGELLLETVAAAIESSVFSRVSDACLDALPVHDEDPSLYFLCRRFKEAGHEGYMDLSHREDSWIQSLFYNGNLPDEQVAQLQQLMSYGLYHRMGDFHSYNLAKDVNSMIMNRGERSDKMLLSEIKQKLGMHGIDPTVFMEPGFVKEIADLLRDNERNCVGPRHTLAGIQAIAKRESFASTHCAVPAPWVGRALKSPLSQGEKDGWIDAVTRGISGIHPRTRE